MDSGLLMNYVLSLMMKKVIVPSGFHQQAQAIDTMLSDDVSGLVDSLTDFAVETADVEFNIETKNVEFTKLLKQWLTEINKAYRGKIPSGIKALAKEYFKERWKGASFPVLKIGKWEAINGLMLPSKLFFVDGGSIHAQDKDEDEELSLLNYDYYLGTKEDATELDENCIFAKYSGRWYDKYPKIYLIKRGVYHNWKIIESLKENQTKILEQVIPYMFLVNKGTEKLAIENVKSYSQPELKAILDEFQSLVTELKTTKIGDKSNKQPIRVANFDEELKHLIPDLSTIFATKLFIQAERNILSGLGFIDVIQGISDTRRESVLNPKIFIEEVKGGVDDFKQILKELILLIKDKNKNHKKYMNVEYKITSSPIRGFMTDEFKEKIRQLYDRGRVSSKTAVELIAEVDFETEVMRREKEAKDGIDKTMYPPVTDNREGQGTDLPNEVDTEDEEIPDDKKDKIEKKNYDIGGDKDLVGAPYQTIKTLPDSVKKKLSPAKQKAWMQIFNKAYSFYMKKFKNAKKVETLAFKTAWSQIKQVKSKNKSKKEEK